MFCREARQTYAAEAGKAPAAPVWKRRSQAPQSGERANALGEALEAAGDDLELRLTRRGALLARVRGPLGGPLDRAAGRAHRPRCTAGRGLRRTATSLDGVALACGCRLLGGG